MRASSIWEAVRVEGVVMETGPISCSKRLIQTALKSRVWKVEPL